MVRFETAHEAKKRDQKALEKSSAVLEDVTREMVQVIIADDPDSFNDFILKRSN